MSATNETPDVRTVVVGLRALYTNVPESDYATGWHEACDALLRLLPFVAPTPPAPVVEGVDADEAVVIAERLRNTLINFVSDEPVTARCAVMDDAPENIGTVDELFNLARAYLALRATPTSGAGERWTEDAKQKAVARMHDTLESRFSENARIHFGHTHEDWRSWLRILLEAALLAAPASSGRAGEGTVTEAGVAQKCPVCVGHGYLDYPKGVAPGQTFAASSTGNYPCHACDGRGLLPVVSINVTEGDIENLRHVGRSAACGPQRGGALLALADKLERVL